MGWRSSASYVFDMHWLEGYRCPNCHHQASLQLIDSSTQTAPIPHALLS